MANKLIMRYSIEPQIETSDTAIAGIDYSEYKIDGNVGVHGGSQTKDYHQSDACKFTGVLSATTTTSVSNAVFEGTPRVGTLPATVEAYYVKFDSKIGSASTVTVSMVYPHGDVVGAADGDGSVSLTAGTITKSHTLSVGDSILIPLTAEAVANCQIKASAYDNGVDEATVTVVLIGD
jgi:hypothetical protein